MLEGPPEGLSITLWRTKGAGTSPIKIQAPTGSLLLFDSRLLHAVSAGSRWARAATAHLCFFGDSLPLGVLHFG